MSLRLRKFLKSDHQSEKPNGAPIKLGVPLGFYCLLKILDDLREILEDEVGVADQKEHLDFARVLQISDKDRHWLMNENTDSLYFR